MLLLCRISDEPGSSSVPYRITHCLKVEEDMSWSLFGDPSTRETQQFVTMFDRLFYSLNVRSLDQWIHKRKPDLKPFILVRMIQDSKEMCH